MSPSRSFLLAPSSPIFAEPSSFGPCAKASGSSQSSPNQEQTSPFTSRRRTTVIAQALCHDEVVQQAFPDGIIWITAGKESAVDLITRLREVGKGLNDDLIGYDTQLGSINRYRTILREKAALIVVDDVWDARDI